MRTRYTLDANTGLLVDRYGETLGRVVSITLESLDGGQGGNTACPSSNDKTEGQTVAKDGVQGKPKAPTPSQLEAEAIARCWDYYFELFPSKRKRPLDNTSKGLLRNALRLVGEEPTRRAILGLSRSPFHNGANDQRKKYLELRYALKGKQREGEADDERIEKAITWAAQYAPEAQNVDPAKVQRDLDAVRYTLGLEHRPERDRALAAWKRLKESGFTVVKLSQPPWARLER